MDHRKVTWGDECLSIVDPGRVCNPVEVDGFWISLIPGSDMNHIWTYHGREDGSFEIFAPDHNTNLGRWLRERD